MNENKPVFVTQPWLPDLEEFLPYLEKIWQSKILTNGGPFHSELEKELCSFLGVNQISLFTNGTIALVTALQALKITGEVITTPYSFVATANSLLWNNLSPIFADINPTTFNIDPSKIENLITPQTTAIMPVHCYGNPCDVEEIQNIASKHNLKVIYDAAHAFGVKKDNTSILNYGDLSVLSFHATKVFHTFEGGAIVSHTPEMKKRIDHLKNFGFENEISVIEAGINGKMSELNAALGLIQIKHVNQLIDKRQSIANIYNSRLNQLKGVEIPSWNQNSCNNFSYYPIVINDSYPVSRDSLYESLKIKNIFTRRYFYPLITKFSMYEKYMNKNNSLTNSKYIADRVLCLPIYPNLDDQSLDLICQTIIDIGT